MRSAVVRLVWFVPIICGAALLPGRIPSLGAQTGEPIALSGLVSSAEEGPMEGRPGQRQEDRLHRHDHGRHR